MLSFKRGAGEASCEDVFRSLNAYRRTCSYISIVEAFKALEYFYRVNSCILFFWALSSVLQLLQMSYDAGSMKCYQILNSLIMSYRPWL